MATSVAPKMDIYATVPLISHPSYTSELTAFEPRMSPSPEQFTIIGSPISTNPFLTPNLVQTLHQLMNFPTYSRDKSEFNFRTIIIGHVE